MVSKISYSLIHCYKCHTVFTLYETGVELEFSGSSAVDVSEDDGEVYIEVGIISRDIEYNITIEVITNEGTASGKTITVHWL